MKKTFLNPACYHSIAPKYSTTTLRNPLIIRRAAAQPPRTPTQAPLFLSQRQQHPARMASSEQPTPSFPPPQILPILREVIALLTSTHTTLSIAETAAGGLISSSLLSQPGASKFYKGGLTLYTLPSRIAYAGWTSQTIASYQGPTTDIVTGLAKQVRRDLESTYTLAESGTAGPTGGATENRKPGYVALAVDCEQGCFVKEVKTGLGPDRVANMVQFAVEALTLLRDVMKGEAKL